MVGIKSSPSRNIFRSIILLISIIQISFGCVIIASEEYNVTATSEWEIYKDAITAGLASSNGILDYTAPKQIRSWLGVMATVYTPMAWCQRSALDFFGRKDASDDNRRCPAITTAQQLELENHAKEAFAYAYLWALGSFVPEWATAINTYALSIGVDLTKCSSSGDCEIDTAAGLARKVYEDTLTVFEQDGWNADGLFTREFNLLPFEDWRPTQNQPNFEELCVRQWKIQHDRCNLIAFNYEEDICWKEEIIQAEGQEYFFQERFHLPHVADTARSYILGNEYICDEIAFSRPCYDLEEEANEVIMRLQTLDDTKKAQIEYFDNHFQWFNFFITETYQNDFISSQWDRIRVITAVTTAMYESTIITWKIKKDFGITRPKSFINTEYRDTIINSYRGPILQDSGNIFGRDWVPYLRDEPTPEYPSHIACMCSVFSYAMDRLTGKNIVGDGTVVSVTKAAGSSTIESNKPGENQTLLSTK